MRDEGWLPGLLAITACIAASGAATGQPYPSRPLRLVVPFVAGGGTDVVARAVAARLGEGLGQTVVVDNRAGAGGIVGTETVARSAPDGYTLLMGSAGPIAVNPSLYAKLSYDPLKDLAPVSLITVMPFLVVVHPGLAASNATELIALARAKPGTLNFGSPGAGSVNHLFGELLRMMAGVDIVHVPYKGVAPATTDLIAGQIQMMSGDMNTLLPHVRGKRLRAIAVTSAKRSSLVPDLPPMADAVPGFDTTGWFGILVASGTPRPVVLRLNRALVDAVAGSDLRERVAGLGGEIAGSSVEAFAAHIGVETAKWAKVIKTAGLRAESTR
jgi:tripartite-type tricarboxylate transporter receptor subunit TctC